MVNHEDHPRQGIPDIVIVVIILTAAVLVGCRLWLRDEQAAAQTASASDVEAVADVVQQLDGYVSTIFENYEITVSDDGKSVLLYLWKDGLAVDAAKAKNGIEPYASRWPEIVNNMQELSMTVQGLFDAAGLDVSASVCVRNDLSPEAVLLMTNKGSVILDAVSGS